MDELSYVPGEIIMPVYERHLCENLSNEVFLFLFGEVGCESSVR